MENIFVFDFDTPYIYQNKVWGNTAVLSHSIGRDLSIYEKENMPVGEVFLVSSHKDGESQILGSGTIDDLLFSQTGVDIFGSHTYSEKKFPLLLKILAASKELSIQNHYRNKLEAWVTLSPGSMFYGLTQEGEKMLTSFSLRQKFGKILYEESSIDTLKRYFNYVEFDSHEVYIISPGMVHALLSGAVFEPQKNCNLTNRGGDWGRKDPNRQLHLDDFFTAIYPYTTNPEPIRRVSTVDRWATEHMILLATKDFVVEEFIFTGGLHSRNLKTDGSRFYTIYVHEGDVTLVSGESSVTLTHGQTALIAARPAEYKLTGTGIAFIVYVPDLTQHIIEPLLSEGVLPQEIVQLGGPIESENWLFIELKERGLI